MNDAARKELLEIARAAVEAAVMHRKPPKVHPVSPELNEKFGAFVTLRTHGNLRGCIGQFEASAPLAEIVQEMGVSSATRDPRFMFDRIRPDELNSVHIDISVIGPLEKISDPLGFELGVHGIYVRSRGRSGCFLPQVATETGWSKEEFLSECCAGKAGLPPDAWKDPATEVLRFSCEVVEE